MLSGFDDFKRRLTYKWDENHITATYKRDMTISTTQPMGERVVESLADEVARMLWDVMQVEIGAKPEPIVEDGHDYGSWELGFDVVTSDSTVG